MVCKALFWEEIPITKGWYLPNINEAKTIVRLQQVAMGDMEMSPISSTNGLPTRMSKKMKRECQSPTT